MVEFDDMSYETLQKAVKKKFEVLMPDKEEEMTITKEMMDCPERFETLSGKFRWIHLSQHNEIKVKQEAWNFSSLDGDLFHIIVDDCFHEIVRRKPK